MNKEVRWRFTFVGASFAFVGLMIIFQMIRLQVSESARDLEKFDDPWYEEVIYPVRGQIFDRWGTLLAGSKVVYEVGLELNYIDLERGDLPKIAEVIHDYVGTKKKEIVTNARVAIAENEEAEEGEGLVLLVVDDYVPADAAQRLEEYITQYNDQTWNDANAPKLWAIQISPHLARSYPEKDLASNILGFVSLMDGRGHFGVEEYYDGVLAGEPQVVKLSSNPNMVEEMRAIPPGTSLILTIDREIQATAEAIIDEAVDQMGADTGTIGIMDPRTGEILAIATTPRLDLNEYWEYNEGYFPNRGVGYAYETGSVFKVLTMTMALNEDLVEANTTYTDYGVLDVGGALIWNWDRNARGVVTMTDCLQYSLNTCLAQLGLDLTPVVFYRYMHEFGIGDPTYIDLAGEDPGSLRDTNHPLWSWSDLGRNTFGQGVSSTVVQMLKAVSALANNGQMVSPHLVKAMVVNGKQHDIQIQSAGNPIAKKTARQITDMLVVSLEKESSDALVPGYTIAGKTGTGEIATEEGYTLEETNASFVGWGPVDDPRFIVYVWLEKPKTDIWGSKTAAKVFSRMVERLVVLMNLPPDELRLTLQGN